MSRPKPPETAQEYVEHQRLVRERFACDSDESGELKREFKTLRAAALILDAWDKGGVKINAPGGSVAREIEEYIAAKVASELKRLGVG